MNNRSTIPAQAHFWIGKDKLRYQFIAQNGSMREAEVCVRYRKRYRVTTDSRALDELSY